MQITQVLLVGLLGAALPVQFAVADTDGERAGSGLTPTTLLTGIASVVLMLAFVWVMWVSLGAFRAWLDAKRHTFVLDCIS